MIEPDRPQILINAQTVHVDFHSPITRRRSAENGAMKIDVALVQSALLLAVSVADFFTSRAGSRRLEDRETII
jgi:hypothetical protein